MDASESRRELEAMIDSMQDAVVAVDQAGRIQWTNQRMQRSHPRNVASAAPSVSATPSSRPSVTPTCWQCVRIALEDRTVSERRSTSLLARTYL